MEGYKNFCIRRDLTTIDKVRWKIIIIFIFMILGILVLMPAVSSADPDLKFTVSIKSSELDYSDIDFRTIEADDHEDYGHKAVETYSSFFWLLKKWSLINFVDYIASWDSLNENVTDWREVDELDDFMAELDGIRDELGLSNTERVVHMGRAYFDLGGEKKCTVTAATDSATAPKGQTFLHQNIDSTSPNIYWEIFSKTCNTVKIDGEYNYAFWGFPCINEFPFLNEKGLGFGGAALRLNPNFNVDTSPDNSYLPSNWLVRRSLMDYQWATPDQDLIFNVKYYWDNSDRASGLDKTWPHHWNNANSMWCDRSGEILAIEQMCEYFVAKYENPIWPDNPDILWHTNHHKWNGTDETGSIGVPDPDPEGKTSSSGARAERAYELLNNTYYGKLNSIMLDIHIARDHFGGRNKDKKDIDDIDNPNTKMYYIIQPKPDVEEVSWTRHVPPFENPLIDVPFDKIFNNEEEKVIPIPSYKSCPNGYYYQSGSIPYLLNKLETYDYLLEDFEDDDNYTLNLTLCASLSDRLTGNKEQSNHDYTISRTNEISDPYNDSYIYLTLVADGIVNASFNNDDPVNKTWTTIQKAVDNMSNLDILIVESGNYTEDITLNKSLIIFGVDENKAILDGSITMFNPHDYELLNENDQIENVNMTGLQLMMYLNNDLRVGENYSNSTNVYDYSPLGNNGTNNNASWTTSTIKGTGAFIFNGTNNSINLCSVPALTGENVTVSSWICWKNGTGNVDPILSQSNATSGYCLYVNCTNNKPVFRLDDAVVVSSLAISDGWHNIVGTHNQTTLKIFVDGVVRGSTAKSGSGVDRNAFVGFDNVSSYFNGTIDEVAVWNRTLSNEEIFHIYDLHYGVVIDGFTIKNSNIGIIPVNHTDITNCVLVNHTMGILIDNVSDIKIQCNFSDCNISLRINNSNPDEFNKIRVMDCNIDNNINGLIINSSSYIDIYRTYFNCNSIHLGIDNLSNFSTINIVDTYALGNESPDTPSLSGPNEGDILTSYTYSSCTNDSDDDVMFYLFDWGDGNDSGWLGPYDSNVTINMSNSWSDQGGYYIRVKAKDIFYNESDWSEVILFKTDTLPPLINSVNNTPDVVGFGGNITITANVTDDTSGNYTGIQTVKVNISYPDNTSGNFTMEDFGNNTFEYVFSDTWFVGQYNYSIWAVDNAYNANSSAGYSFNVSGQATVSVCTIKDSYGDNETVNLTDPPISSPGVGYELLDDGKVLHIWNSFDSYYFDTDNGVQLTNHYDEYWSHNVLMLGYYNNDKWNLIYRSDSLSGFNRDIESDNETFVNATLWKDLTYQGYDFRLAIRYHLGVDDNELTVIPYIKNIDQSDIPYILGFGWEMKDIQIDMTTSGDYINVNRTMYYLNQTLNNIYTDLSEPEFYLMENITDMNTKSLYLKWNQSLTYKLQVKSREGQYNAPVTLFIKIGTLNAGQEKYTKMYWYDADSVTYYFDSYDNNEAWATNPAYMVDGGISNYSSTTVNGDVELCDGNNCSGADLGTISTVEIRVYSFYLSGQRDTILRPVFGGTADGLDNYYQTPLGLGAWSEWFDITNDPFAPQSWGWSDIVNLDCDVEAENDPWGPPTFTLYCSKVEVRVAYTPYNYAPVISDPFPVDGMNGVSIQPVLNITVTDPDGDNMNITWLSNSSGSWQVFGTNSSVQSGTYHQTLVNASVNGLWWFWRVNVSDGDNFTLSDVFSFFTGYESKINNSGSTDIKGYLLIQVQFWNTTLEEWVLASDTVNETMVRRVNSSDQFGLDTLFNGIVNTSDLLSSFGDGTYRVYAAFRDPDGDVLVCDDESLMEDSYQFTVSAG